MRRIVFFALLAGCASVPYDDPCACVVIPDLNGSLSLAMAGEALQLDGADGAPSDRTGVTGQIFWRDRGYTVNGIELDGSDISVEAHWGDQPDFDMTAPAPLVTLRFGTEVRADTGYDGAVPYTLGPRGGTLRLREIVARDGGGWRVRGRFEAQVCPDEVPGPCVPMSGSFAFDAETLPPAGNAGALIPGG